MKRLKLWKIALILLLTILIWACNNQHKDNSFNGQDSPNTFFYNASFEVTYPETETPMQWYSGSEYGLFFEADSTQFTEGRRSLLVKSTQPMQRWGAMSFLRMMDYDFSDSIRTISISMDIKSDSVSEGYFSPFTWKQEKLGEVIVKNLASDSLNGSNNWKRYKVSDTISNKIEQDKIFAGIQLNGKGQVWVDNVELFINGKAVNDRGFNPKPPTKNDLAFIKKHSTPLENKDPYASLNDLAFLSEKIKDAKIVGLGESSHGTSEIFTMKHRLFRFLVEKHGFTTFLLEGHAGASYRINEYIHTGKGDPVELVKNIGFWTWSTEEVLELVKWMRKYNEGVSIDKQLSFIGVDIQGVVEEVNVLDSLSRSMPELNKELMTTYRLIRSFGEKLNKGDYFEGFRDTIKVLAPKAQIALKKIEASEDIISNSTNPLNYHWLHFMAKSVDNYTSFYSVMLNRKIEDPFFLSRDSLMAANIQYVQKHLNPGKAAYWAHNSHIANAHMEPLGNMVGWYLKKEYEDKYKTIGFSFEKGYYQAIDGRRGKLTTDNYAYPPFPGCFEYLLSLQGKSPLFFDFQQSVIEQPKFYQKQPFKQRHLGSMAIDNQFEEVPIHEHFDYFIYFGETSASKKLN